MSRSKRVFRRHPLCLFVQAALPAMFAAPLAHSAVTCNVTSNSDDPTTAATTVTATTTSGTLRDCILAVNLATGSTGVPTSGNTILTTGVQGQTITLGAPLPMIFNNVFIGGSSPAVAIDGAGSNRIFFVSGLPNSSATPEPNPDGAQAITVNLNNLVLQNGKAQGGVGGGGGMGAGGALFVNNAATVNLVHVSFAGNSAVGGNGAGAANFGYGGGGMGGHGGGGGGGLGGSSVDGTGGGGIGTDGISTGGNFGGAGIGQISSAQGFSSPAFGPGGANGSGGIGGGGSASASGLGVGGFGGGGGQNSAGGFGGGGGSQGTGGSSAGVGGFGGGGGTGLQGARSYTSNGSAGAAGAVGGFGAGGGGGGGGGGCQAGFQPWAGAVGAAGGVGGGSGATGAQGAACPGAASANGYDGGGGGGAGFGGAVFVRSGGTLNVTSSAGTLETGGSAAGGAGGAAGAQGPAAAGGGTGAGAGMFFMSGANVTFNLAGNVVINDAVDDDSILSLPGGSYTAGNGNGATINLNGAGTLSVEGNGGIGVVVANNGTLGGTGTVGDVTLDASTGGSIAPGNSPGTLHAHSLHWKGGTSPSGGGIKFQVGSSSSPTNSDLMLMSASLDKDNSTGSNFVFQFSDSGGANGAPTPGATYVLMGFASTTFSASDFSSTYTGSVSGFGGTFSIGPNPTLAPVKGKAPAAGLPPNALMFHVNNPTPVRLQSFEVD